MEHTGGDRQMTTGPPGASPTMVERVIAPGARNDLTGERAPQRRFARSRPSGRLRIALLAPPWIPIPPPGYGGIELVIAELAGGLVRHGHDVALLAAPGSRSSARVVPLLEHDHADQIGQTLFDVDHVGRALEVIDAAAGRGRPFDIVHDHSGFALVAIGDRVDVPVLHTVHGPFTPETSTFYRQHADKVWLSGLSDAQLAAGPPGLRWVGTIPNPINVQAWPLERRKDDYLLWMGRMTEGKGAHRAIAVARSAGRPLVIAGPVQTGQREFFEREIEPHIDSGQVSYVDEVGGERKRELFAHAAALLMPIRWPEPFGMVMIEAMACGTPVIAFPEGSAPEVVMHGRSGFLVDDEADMAAAVDRLDELDPAECRAAVVERYDVDVVTSAYESAYRSVIESQAHRRPAVSADPSPQPERR
jgi:glycosyltransferase involved in cell wall biosynthesis